MASQDSSFIEWIKKLQRKIYEVLKPVVTDREMIKNFIDSEAMKIWKTAFTSKFYDYHDNYENLEYFGDRILKGVFAQYLYVKYPGESQSFYTNLDSFYMKSDFQDYLARKMGLDGYIRKTYNVELPDSLFLGDVFEAFFGALYTIANKIEMGKGQSYCYAMIAHLFKDVNIDLEYSLGSPQSLLDQLFKGIVYKGRGLMSVRPFVEEIRNQFKATVSLLPDHIDFLRSRNINIQKSIISTAFEPSKEKAKFEASKKAMRVLRGVGFGTEQADELKAYKDLHSLQISPYYKQLQQKLAEQGYKRVTFETDSKAIKIENTVVVSLIGIDKDNKKTLLSIAKSKVNPDMTAGFIEVKKQAVINYLQ